MSIVHATDTNFAVEVLKAKGPVLVDFWAEWCGPCRRVGPILEELEKENSGKAKVVKVNVDEASQTATQFSIMSIPTLMVFKDGKVLQQIVGVVPKSELQAMIDKSK